MYLLRINRRAPRLLAITASLLLLMIGAGGMTTAWARQQSPIDELELVDLIASRAGPESPADTIRFEAQLNYRLASAQRGFLLLLIFENEAATSNQQTSEPIPIAAGDGQLSLDIEYQPGADIRTLSLLASLFAEDDSLLSFVATTPISLAPWPGRAAFEDALESRLGGDHVGAAEHLSRAIELSPDTGNYYYWRADTWLRLGRYDAAVLDYTRALDHMPEDRASRVGRGIALLWQGQWQGTLDDLTFVINNSPGADRWTAWAHRARGITYSHLDRPAEAIADYQAYLSLAPNAADRAEVEDWIAALR